MSEEQNNATTTTGASSSSSSSAELSLQQKIETAKRLKEEGNELFKRGEFGKAINRYNSVFLYINGLSSSFAEVFSGNAGGAPGGQRSGENKEVSELRLSCNLNLSICFLKKQKYDKALKHAQEALKVDPNNIKAIFRRGQAYFAKNDLDRAKEDFETIQARQPHDQLVQAEIKRLNDAFAAHKKKEKGLYTKMFQKLGEEDK